MLKRILFLLTLLLFGTAFPVLSQTTVNLSVVDTPDSQAWNSGTWSVKLQPPAGNLSQTNTFTLLSGGGSLAAQSGTLSGTGTASMSLPANANIGPNGTVWQFTVCPQASAGCFQQSVTVSTSSPQTLALNPPSIRINLTTATPPISAYATGEISGAVIGSQFYLLGTGIQVCSATTGNTCTTWTASGGGGGLPSGGNVGQVVVNTAPGAGTWQDPNVSNTPMVLLSAIAATGTQTSSAVKIPIQSATGSLVITGSGITGSPSGCQIALELQQSTGAPASAAYFTQAFTPANSYQGFYAYPAGSLGLAAGDNLIAVYSCSTTYPSAGTITVTFSPTPTASLGTGAISNGQYVTTSQFIWVQFTSWRPTWSNLASSTIGSGAPTTASFFVNFQILTPNGLVSTQYNPTYSHLNAANGCGTGQAFPVNGQLQSITVNEQTAATPHGQISMQVYTLNALPTGGNTSTDVCNQLTGGQIVSLWMSSYIQSFYPVGVGGIVGQNVRYPSEGGGLPVEMGFTAPAAGTATWLTTSDSLRYQVLSVSFVLTTSATAGNRFVDCNVQSSTGQQYISAQSPIAQGPSTSVLYVCSPGSATSAGGAPQAASPNFQVITLGWPANIFFTDATGAVIFGHTIGIQSGDLYSQIAISVLAWQNND